jgi:2,4-dienoyl-CoA reductase-like NADH-dependent reductase (Old Yellow Enzyme family)
LSVLGDADLIALARTILYNPRWPWHAAAHFGAQVKAPAVVTARAKKPCRIAARAAGADCWGNKGQWFDL